MDKARVGGSSVHTYYLDEQADATQAVTAESSAIENSNPVSHGHLLQLTLNSERVLE